MKIKFAALALSTAIGGVSPAHAASIDATYNFEASFADGPNSKISGTVNLAFDAANSADPITFKSFSSSALAGYTANPITFHNRFVIGNCFPRYCSVVGGASEFLLDLEFDSAGEVKSDSSELVYSTKGNSGPFFSTGVTVSRVVSGAVPEPATWALMILGFGAVGYAMRRRQKFAVRFA